MDLNSEDAALLIVFAEEIKALTRSGVHVNLSLLPEEASALVGNLQLALRHPENTGPAALIVHQVLDRIVEQIAPPGSACREVFERGERGE